MILLKFENVTLSYGNNTVIENFSMELSAGDYLCVVGENGSGKSTFLKGLLGLKPPSKGKISLVNLKQREIGYLPQKTDIQKNFPASVNEIVLSGCLNECGFLSFYSKRQKNMAIENMDLLGIRDLKNESFKEISGGQQQRVLLARALCAAKKILILDEPCAGLDPVISKKFYKIIKNININKNIAIVMVSHDIRSALSGANTVIHMQQKPVFFETVEKYRESFSYKRFLGGV